MHNRTLYVFRLRVRAVETAWRGWHGIAVAIVAALAAAAGALVAAVVLLPPPQVLPASVAGLMLAAATTALIAWAAPPEAGRARIMFWDIAGALTAIGVCAALFGETGEAVALLERDR
jgi:hypothetical protein